MFSLIRGDFPWPSSCIDHRPNIALFDVIGYVIQQHGFYSYVFSPISVAGLFTLVPLLVGLGPIVFITVSGAINVALSALIILRLYGYKKSTQNLLGICHGRLYTRIMVMLTESCALIVVFTVLYIALFFSPKPNGNQIPLFLLPHICVSVSFFDLLM